MVSRANLRELRVVRVGLAGWLDDRDARRQRDKGGGDGGLHPWHRRQPVAKREDVPDLRLGHLELAGSGAPVVIACFLTDSVMSCDLC